MRLINADPLKAESFGVYDSNGELRFVVDVNEIDEQPTVDAVQVVRCEDCKYWDKKDDAPYGYCMAMKHGFVSSHWEIGIYRTYKGDFYCANGERREEDE